MIILEPLVIKVDWKWICTLSRMFSRVLNNQGTIIEEAIIWPRKTMILGFSLDMNSLYRL